MSARPVSRRWSGLPGLLSGLLAGLGLAACGDGGASGDGPAVGDTVGPVVDAAVDAAADSSSPGDAAVPDAGATCACDPDESCEACFAHIGVCCYGDESMGGAAAAIAASCERAGACRACCDECAETPCEVLVARNSCPILDETDTLPVAPKNGLEMNGSPLQALPVAPLTTEALAADEGLLTLLASAPGAAIFLKYLVECALPPEATVSVPVGDEMRTLAGSMGLAPEWAEGPCDTACQEWITACLLARTNAYQLPVRIFLSGPHPALTADGTPEAAGYTVREGAFYGNYFQPLPAEYSCRGDGYDPLYQTVRVCSRPGNLCGFAWVGACGDVDGDTGQPAARRACEGTTEAGDYTDCHDRASLAGEDGFPSPNRTYARVITIWVRPSGFAPGIDASGFGTPEGPIACGDAAPTPPDPGPADPGEAEAGTACRNDDACDSELLRCDTRSQLGFCTAPCTPDPDRATERAACGGETSTCLDAGGGEGFCTRACTPLAGPGRAGDCEAGRVCTHNWVPLPEPDPVAGCYPFCSSDADCPLGAGCHTRLGGCGGHVDDTLLPDGEPCDFTEAPCRGACIVVGDRPEEGLCASFLDQAVTRDCPDSPERMQPLARGARDDLRACLYKSCRDDAECTAPLKCVGGVLPGQTVCTWP